MSESTTLSEDLVVAAADDKPMTVHARCPFCEPVWRLGMTAICGEKMLGIALPKMTTIDCAVCAQGCYCDF